MKIYLEIDEKLLETAMTILGNKTKKVTIEAGLKLIITQNQNNIKNLKGKIKWDGDLDQMRTD